MLVSWVVCGATTNRHYLRILSLALTIPWTCLVLFMVSTLLSFHLYLIFRGQTTNEYFRERRARKVLASPPGSPPGQNKAETTAERLMSNNESTVKSLMTPPSKARCWKMVLWKADGHPQSSSSTGPGNLSTESSSNGATLGSAHTSRSPHAAEGVHLPPMRSSPCAAPSHKDYISSAQAAENVLTPLYDAESTPFPQLSPNSGTPQSPDYMDSLQYQPLSLHVGVSPRGVSPESRISASKEGSLSPESSPDDLSTSPEERDPFASLSPENKIVLSQMRANLAQHRRNLTVGIGAGAHSRVPSLTLIFPQPVDDAAHPAHQDNASSLTQGSDGQERGMGGASEAPSASGSTSGSVMSTLACLPCGAVACLLRLCGWRPNSSARLPPHVQVPTSPPTPAVQKNVRYTYCYLCCVVPVVPRSKLLPLWRRAGPEDTEQQQYLLERLLEKIREAQRWDDEMFNDHSV